MPDEITIKPKSESAPVFAPDHQTASSGRVQLTNLCALGLGISFFLPWAHFFLATPSGFDLQKLGDEQRLLWPFPFPGPTTTSVGATKRSKKRAGQSPGALPFCVGAYWYN